MTSRLWHHGEQYEGPHLDPSTCPDDPLELFRAWYATADAANPGRANPMTLATVGADGRPVARMVLLKELDDRGFVFYGNHDSRNNPHPSPDTLTRTVRGKAVVGIKSESLYWNLTG